MSFQDASGTTLNKTEMLALATSQATETVYKFNSDVYQKVSFDGGRFEDSQRLLFHSGQLVKASDIDGLFKTATVDTVAPAGGLAAGGTAVTITGTNLGGVEGVTFGGTAATAVVVVSNERVTCTAPAHAAGSVNVVVKDDSGDVTKTGAYLYA